MACQRGKSYEQLKAELGEKNLPIEEVRTVSIWALNPLLGTVSCSDTVGWVAGRASGACKKTEWWGTDVVICLEQGADLHMAQLMPLPLTVSCFSKIQTGFIFLVPAHPGSPGQRAVKRVCVCV